MVGLARAYTNWRMDVCERKSSLFTLRPGLQARPLPGLRLPDDKLHETAEVEVSKQVGLATRLMFMFEVTRALEVSKAL